MGEQKTVESISSHRRRFPGDSLRGGPILKFAVLACLLCMLWPGPSRASSYVLHLESGGRDDAVLSGT